MASYSETHKKPIIESFRQFDEANPKVYELFKKFTLEVVKRKGKGVNEVGEITNTVGNPVKTSAKLLLNRIRWEIYMETISVDDTGFRINDIYSAHYARKFIKEYPQYKSIFNLRELRSAFDRNEQLYSL